MTKLAAKNFCVGCGACAAACPLDCITMKEDVEGFLYPEIDTGRCIACGTCENACPVNREWKPNGPLATYAAKSLQEETRSSSSSGGIFTLLSREIFASGGVVFGVALNDKLEAVHRMADGEGLLTPLRGSKYLQSQMGTVYNQIDMLLRQDKPVFFTGTPCQVAGLKSFLGRDEEKLLCADIVCHGVPSQKAWRRYVAELEKEYGAKLKTVLFRDKTESWRSYRVTACFENGKVRSVGSGQDPFLRGYLANLYLRPSCHNCQKDSAADITLGDCWGAEALSPELHDDKGTSLVIIRTEKGAKAFAAIGEFMDRREIAYSDAVAYNPSISTPAKENFKRSAFFARQEEPFGKTVEELAKTTSLQKWKMRLRSLRRKLKS